MIGESLMKELMIKMLQDKGKPTRYGETAWGYNSRERLGLKGQGTGAVTRTQ